MHRFFLPPEHWIGVDCALSGEEAHHAGEVLRLHSGDICVVFDGQGREGSAEVLDLRKHSVRVRITETRTVDRAPVAITLAQAIPKGKNMEFIVEKATELGVAVIQPLVSERTIARPGEEAGKKQQKWQKIAMEACKQSGQNWMPTVNVPRSMNAFFQQAPTYDLAILGSLQSDALPLRLLLQSAPADLRSILVLVGPEGDFSPSEIDLARARHCRSASLGPIVLRCETAAMYLMSVLSCAYLAGTK